MTDRQLTDSVCVITGAGSGIGAATARRFATAGATVLAADVRQEAVEEVVKPLENAYALHVDVSDEQSVSALVALGRGLSGRPADILVNAAGIGSTTNAPTTTLEAWEDVFAVNARGTFLCCKHLLPDMIAAGGGAIVNVASVAGLVGLRNRAAYCAAKGAVVALTRALAIDHVRDNIRVNCVCPGTIDTPWVHRLIQESGEDIAALQARQPMGRLGTPEEVADAIYYLAAPISSFATGSTLVLDGGLTAA
jgi:NAD(P)-dependent dehydrogenase (short-subunit alcohol dehydrogenase family)